MPSELRSTVVPSRCLSFPLRETGAAADPREAPPFPLNRVFCNTNQFKQLVTFHGLKRKN